MNEYTYILMKSVLADYTFIDNYSIIDFTCTATSDTWSVWWNWITIQWHKSHVLLIALQLQVVGRFWSSGGLDVLRILIYKLNIWRKLFILFLCDDILCSYAHIYISTEMRILVEILLSSYL